MEGIGGYFCGVEGYRNDFSISTKAEKEFSDKLRNDPYFFYKDKLYYDLPTPFNQYLLDLRIETKRFDAIKNDKYDFKKIARVYQARLKENQIKNIKQEIEQVGKIKFNKKKPKRVIVNKPTHSRWGQPYKSKNTELLVNYCKENDLMLELPNYRRIIHKLEKKETIRNLSTFFHMLTLFNNNILDGIYQLSNDDKLIIKFIYEITNIKNLISEDILKVKSLDYLIPIAKAYYTNKTIKKSMAFVCFIKYRKYLRTLKLLDEIKIIRTNIANPKV